MVYTPTYVASDLPKIGTDVVGTTGAAVVPLIPLAVGAGVIYWGAKFGKKKYDKYKKHSKSGIGKGWWFNREAHSEAAKKGKIRMYKRK
jgi:hypothetical protein